MKDEEIVLDELFEAARDLRAPEGAEARGWARFEAALGDAGTAVPGQTAASTLAGLAPAAKVGGVLAVLLALGVVLSGRDDPSPATRTAAREPTKAAPLVRDAPPEPNAAPIAALPPERAVPSPPLEPTRVRSHPANVPRPTPSRSAAATAPAELLEPAEPAPDPPAEVVVVQRPSTLPAASAPPAVPPADALRLEAELLGRAWVAIREGRAADTRALLAEHASRFPRGALAPERHACQLVAGCIAGEHNAIDRARRYLDEHRASHLAARVADGCGLARPAQSSDEIE